MTSGKASFVRTTDIDRLPRILAHSIEGNAALHLRLSQTLGKLGHDRDRNLGRGSGADVQADGRVDASDLICGKFGMG